MNTYIIAISFEQNTTTIRKTINKFGNVIFLFDNTFLINTETSATRLRDELRNILNEYAQIYICKLDKGSAWGNLNITNTEIKNFYKKE